MKKELSFILAAILSITLFALPAEAEKPALPEGKSYTLSEIRALALKNAEKLDTFQSLYKKYEKEMKEEENRIGEKYKTYDESGKEITKYTGGSLSYDYPSKLEEFEKKIKNLKKQNELAAIQKYHAILSKQIEITKKKNALEMSRMDELVAQKRLEAGHILALDYELAKANTLSVQEEQKRLETELAALFEDLSRLTGLKKTDRYTLDSEQLVTKVPLSSELKLALPAEAAEYVRKDSSLIKDLKQKITEKKKQLELFSKSNPEGTAAYTAKEKELDIYGLEKELDKNSKALYFDLEEDYLRILLSILQTSDLNEQMEFQKYETDLMKVKYQTGMISKRDYLQSEEGMLDFKNDLITQALATYEKILRYEIKTGKALLEVD